MSSNRYIALQDKSIFISCIVPVFNEETVIETFIEQLNRGLASITQKYEIIIVDDGSQDNTLEKALALVNSKSIKVIGFSRNFGKEIALTAGIEHCSGDVAILIDSDFQHPIDLIPTFLRRWAEGYDMVYGVRKDRKLDTYLKRGFTYFFYWLMEKISKIDIPNNAGDFRLLDKKIITAIQQFPERSRFMKGLYAWVGYRKIGVPYEVKIRKSGRSSWGFAKLTELAITGITSFSDVPLRVWSFIGFFISFLSLLYAIFIVVKTWAYGADLPGFPSLIVAIMFLGGIQLLSIGILGEYIARIFTEVKQRPHYLIKAKEGFNE